MILNFSNAAKIRDLIKASDVERIEGLCIEGVTLGAVIELCCTDLDRAIRIDPLWQKFYSELCERFGCLDAARIQIQNAGQRLPLKVNRQDTPVELHAVALKEDFEGHDWIAFQENFVKRLQSCGFERKYAFALAAAFTEMAQNIADHSASAEQPMAFGIVGYHVVAGEAHFAVGDVGRGALASLHENPRWDGLENHSQALEQILWHHATRKPAYAEGGGFNQVWKSFLDRNGILSVHSGDGYVEARVAGAREQKIGFTAFLPGVRVCASCFLKNPPHEAVL